MSAVGTASPAAPPPDTADEDDKDTVNRLEEVEVSVLLTCTDIQTRTNTDR
ncbi:hypothetical protein E2C01_099552 [Portunus trituberculatus]|uniref:Uncharacterized protein n=1 Tax=Portunus trituberculatus TaxID=210409 RepID=A0A5B7KB23_PORTR|nr:hypothetical protein [Portunus trituberculatus]